MEDVDRELLLSSVNKAVSPEVRRLIAPLG
jgi:hypothetical protein